MGIRRIQQSFPAALPLSLTDAKIHLRVEATETAYDADITHLIRAAGKWVEDNCHVTLITTTFDIVSDKFPEYRFDLPVFPVISISDFNYYDVNGDLQGIADWQENFDETPCAVFPYINETWPDTQAERIDAVRITLSAGYGTSESDIPVLVKHLIRLLVGHWFKNREAVVVGSISKEIEIAADNLTKMLRVNEFEAFQ